MFCLHDVWIVQAQIHKKAQAQIHKKAPARKTEQHQQPHVTTAKNTKITICDHCFFLVFVVQEIVETQQHGWNTAEKHNKSDNNKSPAVKTSKTNRKHKTQTTKRATQIHKKAQAQIHKKVQAQIHKKAKHKSTKKH